MAKPPTTPDEKAPQPRRRRPAPRKDGPQLLGTLLSDAEAASAERAGIGVRLDTWRAVVGDRIARSASPGRIYQRTLTVRVASAVWAQELSFLADDLVARLQTAGVGVDALRFSVTKSGQEPAKRARPRAKPAPPAPLPEDLAARLEQIDDPVLREIVAEAAQSSLAVKQRAPTSKRRGARAPRSAARENDPPDRGGGPESEARQRKRGA